MVDRGSETRQPMGAVPSAQAAQTNQAAPTAPVRVEPSNGQGEAGDSEEGTRVRWYAIGGSLAALLLFIIVTVGLYLLGDDDQSALERLRDIAVIYIVLMSLVLTILMAGITAALIFLILQIRDQVIPLLKESNATLARVRGTTEFMSEEAVKPIITAAGKAAQLRAMISVATGTKRK